MIAKSYEIEKNPTKFSNFNLFLLYGENYGLKQDIKKSIKSEVTKKDSDSEFLNLYENDVINNPENFYNSIFSGSLFSSKKIITINNGTDKTLKQLEPIADKYSKNIFLIIISDQLEKKSKLRNFFENNNQALCVPCYLDNERDLENIAKTILKKHNITLSRESINLLIEKSNNDRNNLKNEIEKIKSYSTNKKSLEHNEIASIINFSGEYKSDSLINECLCGNISQYKKILSELYDNTVNQILIYRILSNKVQRLIIIKENEKENKNLDNLINFSKPPIFWKEKPLVKKQLTLWNLNDLKKIIYEMNEAELLCKKNPKISKTIFFNFFTKICSKANNYSLSH